MNLNPNAATFQDCSGCTYHPKEIASKLLEAIMKRIGEVEDRTKDSKEKPQVRFIELDFSGERPQPENRKEWIVMKLKANNVDPDSELGRIITQDFERSYAAKDQA